MKVLFWQMLLSVMLFSQTINEQIHALSKATPKERVALMNSIKEQLISMNAQKRSESMAILRKKLQAKEHQDTGVETSTVETTNDEHTEDTSSETEHSHEGLVKHSMPMHGEQHGMNADRMGQNLHQHRSSEMHMEERNNQANNPPEGGRQQNGGRR